MLIQIQIPGLAKSNNLLQISFYLNTKDGGLTIKSCDNLGNCAGNDITLRYDVGNNILYSYSSINTNPSIDYTWNIVNVNEYLYWADIKDCGDYYWFIGQPNTPEGFYISGSVGENPTLHWDQNIEYDLAGYKIYSSYNGSPFSLLTTINNPAATQFTDNGVVISGGRFDPPVCYKISAFDTEDYESDKSFPECVKSNIINKDNLPGKNNNNLFDYKLFDAFPNPFNPVTKITYQVPDEAHVKLAVYNLIGEEIEVLVDKIVTPGTHEVEFNAMNQPSGIYICKIITNSFTDIIKINLVK